MQQLALCSAILFEALCLAAGCTGDSHDCGDHKDGASWCEGSTIMQCAFGITEPIANCPESVCTNKSERSAQCVLQGATCPTDALGYQCLGERRITCLPNGLVTDEGACSPQTPAQKQGGQGPYCVENPGGPILPCGLKKEKCANEGQLTCFDDGSAVCVDSVYQYFSPNNKGSQATCSDTPLANCWAGKTWCEGDVLKRCDRCLDPETCQSITVEATCSAGACVPYPTPAWMKKAAYVQDTTLYGCLVDNTACVGRTGMACMDGTAATCIDGGKTVVGLSCEEFQLLLGGGPSSGPTKFGPFCVERPATTDAICALDPVPCAPQGATRCAPSDATFLDTCQEGVWLRRASCEDIYQTTTICQPATSGAVCK